MTEVPPRALRIESIEVAPQELQVVVRILAPEYLRTSAVPGLAECALEALPGLVRHRCDNDASRSFVHEARDTETAHLLEHVTIELMALSGSPRELAANTSWDFRRDGKGVFRLSIGYDDDVAALASLKAASHVIEWLFGAAEKPDIAQAVALIAEKRSL